MCFQIGEYTYYRGLLWTAPEHLRMKEYPRSGTQKGDVYSFAIVVQEIACRAQPYFCDVTSEPKSESFSVLNMNFCFFKLNQL
jgi:Protein tyrosine and serine/threonine kinase